MKTSSILSALSFLCCILPFALGALFCYLGNGTLEAASLLSAFITFPLASFLLDASLDSEAGRKIYQNQKVGGIRFMRLGRLSFSFSVSKGKKKQVRVLPIQGQEWVNSGTMFFPNPN